MSTVVELARQEWEEGYRRIQRERDDPARYRRLLEQIEAVSRELRRRLGGPFTLAELADVYRGAERWAVEAIAARAARPGWVESAATATDAAFHLYSRGAQDYRP